MAVEPGSQIEGSFATGFGGLFGCGASMITLILALAVSMAANWYFVKQFFAMLRDARTAREVVKEVADADGKN